MIDLDSLPPLEVAPRVGAVQGHLREAGLDALLVTDMTNVRWISGFTGSSGSLLVLDDHLVLVTDGRYAEQAAQQMQTHGVAGRVVECRTQAALQSALVEETSALRSLGFEANHLTVAAHSRHAASLSAELVPTTGLVEKARRRKDAGEVARMAVACQIADAALADVWPLLDDCPTEIDVRNALETRMRELGADGPSYETIVATGTSNAPLPHHRPDRTVVHQGHTVIIDVGALVDGYHSDMTRTFVVGRPSALQQDVYDAVLAAQLAGVAAVGPGVPVREVDAACRRVLSDAGLVEWFSHGTGHGVGLLIHEDPFLNGSSDAVLEVGDVVTVEPGVYRGDFGGVRVEDLVLVTTDGCRTLTSTPKDTPCPRSRPTT